MNQWIEDYLHQFVSGQQNNWSALLPIAEFAHNSWKHKHTNHSPHELIMGMNPTASFSVPEDPIPAAQDCLEELMKTRSNAQKALQRHIKSLNTPCTFVPGDKVLLDARNLKVRAPSRKLTPRRYGPYEVLKQIFPMTYCIKLSKSLHIHNVFHVDLLIPFHETKEHRTNYMQPPPKLIDEEEEYEVEEIINDRFTKRGRRSTRQYLVKWKGYPVSENSWVDSKDLHAPQLQKEYLQSKLRRTKLAKLLRT